MSSLVIHMPRYTKAEDLLVDIIETHKCLEEEINDPWFSPMEAGGGNYDDVYYLGQNVGEYRLAQRVLEVIREEKVNAESE